MQIYNRVRLFPDSLAAGGSTTLNDMLYGSGKFEVRAPSLQRG